MTNHLPPFKYDFAQLEHGIRFIFCYQNLKL
jgi:hypothetical protein